MNAYLLGALLFIVGMVIFIVQNDAQVTVEFLTWQSNQVSLAVVIIISACTGALIAFLLDTFRSFKNKQQTRRLTKTNQKYEQQIDQLKSDLAQASVPGGPTPPASKSPESGR